MASSGKIPTYFGALGRYTPPLRESIADHLDVARRRLKIRGATWEESAITVPFVLSLIKDEIINGPEPAGAKRSGPGVAQRFKPRDYRDLLEVINLKLQGSKHKNEWVLHLWLRGHEYPLARVRAALIAVIESLISDIKSDIAPTGRWTEPFSKKYDRRVRKSTGADPELVDALEPLAAVMIRPNALAEINPDLEQMTRVVANAFCLPPERARWFLETVLAGVKEGKTFDIETQAALQQTIVSSKNPMIENLLPMIMQSAGTIQNRMTGMLDDGSGHSQLIESIKAATDEHLLRARAWYRLMRSGVGEHAISVNKATLEEQGFPAEFTQVFLTDQRRKARSHPLIGLQIFATYVADEVSPNAIKPRRPIDVDATLQILREENLMRPPFNAD